MNPLPTTPEGLSAPLNVLLVDDLPANLLVLRAVLEPLGPNLVTANSGADALRHLLDQDFALILLDVQMPGMDGFETARLLRQRERSRHTPIIFLTATGKTDDLVAEGYLSGAVDYLFKPYEPAFLRAKVKVFLDLAAARHRLETEVAERQRVEREILRLNETLEQRVLERTAALRESEARFRLMVENVKDYAIILLDAGGHIVSWNAGAQHLKGYQAEEIVGQHFSRFYPPAAIEGGKPARELAVAAAEGRVEDEGWRLRKDGSLFYAHVVITALRDEHGQIRGFAKITRDITERQRAEQELRDLNVELEQRVQERTQALSASEERFRSFFELSADLVCIADMAGRFRQVNVAWTRVLGYSEAELLARPYFEFIHPEDRVKTAQLVEKQLKRGQTVLSFENRYVRKDGGLVCLEWTAQPSGAMGLIFAVARDVTERKQTEAALREARDSLERRAAELEAFNRVMVDREKRIIEMKEEVNALCQELGRKPEYPPVWRRGS